MMHRAGCTAAAFAAALLAACGGGGGGGGSGGSAPPAPSSNASVYQNSTTLGSVAYLAGASTLADVCLALLIVAATLESVFAVCLGCHAFNGLMRVGLVPESVCIECANLGSPGTRARTPAA